MAFQTPSFLFWADKIVYSPLKKMVAFRRIRADPKRYFERVLQIQVFLSHFFQYLNTQIWVCIFISIKNNPLNGTELDGKRGLRIDGQSFLKNEFQDDFPLLAWGKIFRTHRGLDFQDVIFLSERKKSETENEKKKKKVFSQSYSSVIL